jgi:hypothetical protein
VADIAIAGALIYFLLQLKSTFASTNAVLRKVIIFAIPSGAVTAIFALASFALVEIFPHTSVSYIFGFP